MALSDPHISVEDYLELEKQSDVRHEYVDGHMYALAGGTLDHSTICINLGREISLGLRGSACRVYTSDAKVSLSESRYVYPDLTVSCDERDSGTNNTLYYPRVVIEVLSPGTEGYDRGKKFQYYRNCPTIQEYVLVDAQMKIVELFRRASPKLWTFHTFYAEDKIVLASVQLEIPVENLYENVSFS